MKIKNKSKELRPDRVECMLGNNFRCYKCGHAFNQGRAGPDSCPKCKSLSIFMLEGFEDWTAEHI